MDYRKLTIEELVEKLADVNKRIEELRSYGGSWALDCREMRILEANQDLIWSALHDKYEAAPAS